MRQDPAQEQEWVRQNNLIYGALIAIGVFMVQPFLTATSLDLSAKICVVAFSVAIPLLAALVLVNRQEAFRRRRTTSVLVSATQVVGEVCACEQILQIAQADARTVHEVFGLAVAEETTAYLDLGEVDGQSS